MFSTKLQKCRKVVGLPPSQEPHHRLGHSGLSPWPFRPPRSLPPISLYQNTPMSKVRNILQILLHFRPQHFRTFALPHFCIIVSPEQISSAAHFTPVFIEPLCRSTRPRVFYKLGCCNGLAVRSCENKNERD